MATKRPEVAPASIPAPDAPKPALVFDHELLNAVVLEVRTKHKASLEARAALLKAQEVADAAGAAAKAAQEKLTALMSKAAEGALDDNVLWVDDETAAALKVKAASLKVDPKALAVKLLRG